MKKNVDAGLREVQKCFSFDTFDEALDPIVVTNADWEEGIVFIYVNEAFCRETGYTKNEVIGKSPKILQCDKTDRTVLKNLKQDLLEGKNFTAQAVNIKKDGTEYIVQWSISSIKNDQDEVVAYISFQKVVTKLEKIENENFLFQAVLKKAPGMILVTDIEGVIVYVNDSFCSNMGYTQNELVGKHTRMLKSGKQNRAFYRNMWETLIREGEFEDIFVNRKKDKTIFYDKKKITGVSNENGDVVYYFSVSYDVTKERRQNQRMLEEIYKDSLTGLQNRKKYEYEVDTLIDDFYENKNTFSLILFDVDFFKKINDTYGHHFGDYALKEMARLGRSVMIKGKDQLFRWGGEEFAILTKRNLEDAVNLAKVLNIMMNEHNFDGVEITISCGVAQMEMGMDKNTILKAADVALYNAKNGGRNRVCKNTKL